MATITRTDLYHALEEASCEFLSDEAYDKLKGWAYDVNSFTVGDWDECPLDQIGLVNKFERRSRYSEEEDARFRNEASELDAQLLKFIKSDLSGHLVGGLKVYVTG